MEEGLHNDRDSCYRPRIEGVLTQFLPIVNQIVNNRRIRQCGGVTKVTKRLSRYVSQNTAHDFAGSGFGKTVRPLNLVGRRDRTDDLADVATKAFFKSSVFSTLLFRVT